MDRLWELLLYVPNGSVLPKPPFGVILVVLAAVTGWSSLLAHRAIANFHDGLRPLYPELLQGRMTRQQLAASAFSLSAAFVIGFGLPFTLASGLVMVYMLLLPADIIGTASSRSWIALILGVLWGIFIAGLTQAIFLSAERAPVDFLQPLQALYLPVKFAILAFPALAVAFQFGPQRGAAALLLTGAVYLALAAFVRSPFIEPVSASMLVGMFFLLFSAWARDRKAILNAPAQADEEVEDIEFTRQTFAANAGRVRKNIPWLMVQGALLALACRLWIFSGSEADFAFIATGQPVPAALADIFRGFAFTPLIVISTLTTGVYQAVGLTLVFAAGFLSPHPWVAPLAGAAVIFLEVSMLTTIGAFLDRQPSIRESAEHLRGSLAKVFEIAVLVGSGIAAQELLPGGLGLFVFFSLYVLNEAAGQKVYRLAIGPLAALVVGLLANLLAVLNVST